MNAAGSVGLADVDDDDIPKQYHVMRPPQDKSELWLYVAALWGIIIPRVSVCRNHCAPFDAFANAYFAEDPVAVWWGSRGFAGKTRTLSALGMTEAVALAAEVAILGGSGAQSLNVNDAGREYWAHDRAPRNLLTQEPTKYDSWFHNGAHIRTLMASQTSVRGQHPQRMRLDEIDEMELAIYDAAAGCAMRKTRNGIEIETQTVASSTWQYPDKTMAEVLRRAADRGWPTFQWCWRETSNPVDGWLTVEEVDRKRQEVPAAMWEAEYDLQEPSFENRAFDTAAVETAFDRSLGEIDTDTWDIRTPVGRRRAPKPGAPVVDPAAWISHGHHVHGIDWAKERDLTVVASFDARSLPWTCVAWQAYNRQPWPVQVARAEKQVLRYEGTLAHDATGIGNVVSDFIDPAIKRRRGRYHEVIIVGGRARADLFMEYISAIENGDIVYPRIQRAYEEHKYCSMDDLFGKGHPPDSVVAGAIAWSVRSRKNGSVTLPTGHTRSQSPWWSATQSVSTGP